MNFALYYLYFNHICTILELYHHFILIFGIIHNFPIFLELTLHREETLFSMLSTFSYSNDVIFWKERNVGAKEANEQRPEGQNRVGPRGQIPWPCGTHHLGP